MTRHYRHLWHILYLPLVLVACTPHQSIAVAAPQPRPVVAAPDLDDEPEPVFEQVGKASWYGRHHQGKLTASGERFDMNELTAAHRSLPLDTRAKVTNLANGRSVEVTVNDRGPYVKGRVIDLSARAARELGLKKQGVGRVRIEVMPGDEPIEEANAAE
jgi:rare lipoprotein A